MSKSTGQWVGTIVGAVAGFFTGGATWYGMIAAGAYGAGIGNTIGGIIDPPKGPSMVGPRLSDLSGQTCGYGAVIPRVYGTVGLYGNLFWLENNKLKEVAKKSDAGGKGGGGSEITTYSYYATFAVGLCQGPIVGIRRLWVGSKLIYDAGSDDISTVIASNAGQEYWTLYTGSETQEADPRMQATLGISDTPAFRGLAYLVIKDYPLKDHGNSLLAAQVKVEIVNSEPVRSVPKLYASPAMGTDRPQVAQMMDNDVIKVFSMGIFDGVYGWPSGGQLTIHDVSGNVLAVSTVPTANSMVDTSKLFVVANALGEYSAIGWLPDHSNAVQYLYEYSNEIGYFEDIPALNYGWKSEILRRKIKGEATRYIGVPYIDVASPVVDLRSFVLAGVLRTEAQNIDFSTNYAGTAVHLSLSEDGERLGMYCAQSGLMTSAATGNVTLVVLDASTLSVIAYSAVAYAEFLGWGGESGKDLYVVNVGTNAVQRLDSNDFSVLESWSPLAGYSPTNFPPAVLSRSLISYEGNIYLLKKQVDAVGVALKDIVGKEVSNSALLSTADIDTAQLTDLIAGYRVGSVGAIRAAIEPLQGIWPFDVIPRGYGISFLRRGGSSVATIQESDLGARAESGKPETRLSISREMDSQLPARLTIKYLDAGREYEQNEQMAERLNTDAVNLSSLEVAVVMDANTAIRVAEKLLYLRWLERYDLGFQLPPSWGHLEPGDVVTLHTTTGDHEIRLVNLQYNQEGVIEVSARYNSSSIYVSTAVSDGGQQGSGLIELTGPSLVSLLDIPCLIDGMNAPGFVGIVSGYLSGWSGGTLLRSSDGGQTWAITQGFVRPSATVGYLTSAPGSPANTALVDKSTIFNVKLYSGELVSVTEAQMFNGANHFAIGSDGKWEIIAAQNCTLQADGSYLLSDLLRGRFGTEWAMGGHAPGEKIVLLNGVGQEFIGMTTDSIGMPMLWKGITISKGIDSDDGFSFTYKGVNLECLSPVYLNGNRHPTTNDWTLTWVRRTRVGGEWRDKTDARLSEDSEAYEVEIYSSNTYATLKRTITGLSSSTCTYTSANQVADFGSNQATLYVKIYQLSATVGRGYPLTASITR